MIGFYLNIKNPNQLDGIFLRDSAIQMTKESQEPHFSINQHSSEFSRPKDGLSILIGERVDVLKTSIGEPVRKEPSPYGYQWWIYNNEEQYIQAGVENERITTIYALGRDTDISPFRIGQSVEDIFSNVIIDADIEFEYEGTSYRFELSEDEMNTSPLVKLGDIYVQLYIDKFSGVLSSVRFLTAETLVKIRPYELVYRGELADLESIDNDVWAEIEEGSKKQIFDITNVIRKQISADMLEWDEETAQAAYFHSMDMHETGIVSHSSKRFGELTDRLKERNIDYQIAGENIAANYIDAPAVMAGWLNSEPHRENLLNRDFTHIGVGVYHKNFTQNFIKKGKK